MILILPISDEILLQMPMPNPEDVPQSAVQDMEDFSTFHVPKKRFSKPTSAEELAKASVKQYSENTKTKVKWVMKVYNDWVTQWNGLNEFHKVPRDLLKVDKKTVCDTISKFIMEVRKNSGDPYPRETLFEMMSSMQIHFHMHGQYMNFF